MNPTQTQLDPQVMAMTKAIRQVESQGNFQTKGKSGEYGGYQFTPDTWNAASQKYLGQKVDLFQATPEQQNQVAYKQIEEWKNQGYNIGQVASMWNAGKGKPDAYLQGNAGTNSQGVRYDTAKYAQDVATAYQGFKQQMMQSQPQGGIPVANAETPGAIPQQSTGPSVSGFVQNAATSAGNLVGGLAQAAMHPIDTASSVLGMAAGGIEKAFGVQPNEDTQKFDALTGYLKQRYGGDSLSEVMGHIGNTLYTDPVGAALDISTVVDGMGAALGAAGKVGKIAELSKAADLLKQAGELVNPIAAGAKVAGKIVNTATDIAKFGASKMIGLNKAEDVTSIINNYDKLAPEQRAAMSREGLATEFGNSVDQADELMKEGGKMKGGVIAANSGKVIVAPDNWLSDVLEHGTSATLEDGSKAIPFKMRIEPIYPPEEPGVIQMEPPKATGYKVVADTYSKTTDPKVIAAIQNFVDKWQPKLESGISAEEFDNMRTDASKMGKFGRELGTNKDAALIGRAIRADANKTMRGQITGLKESDSVNAPRLQEFARIKKEFLTPSLSGVGYEFKPGAPNKIFNALGKGKGDLARFIEKISPGMIERIQLMKTVESIESTYNMKVGTYAKDIIGAGALLHGNVPAVIAAVVSHPSIAIPLLRGLGWTKAQIAPVLQFLRTYINSNTLRYPAEAGKITNDTKQQTP